MCARNVTSTSSGSSTPHTQTRPSSPGSRRPPPTTSGNGTLRTASECVAAVGAWGGVPQSTVDDLTALNLNLDQTIAPLGKADGILHTENYCIYRQGHANTTAAPRAAAPRGAPTTP